MVQVERRESGSSLSMNTRFLCWKGIRSLRDLIKVSDSTRQNSIKKELTGHAWHRLNLSLSQAVAPYRMNSFLLRFLSS